MTCAQQDQVMNQGTYSDNNRQSPCGSSQLFESTPQYFQEHTSYSGRVNISTEHQQYQQLVTTRIRDPDYSYEYIQLAHVSRIQRSDSYDVFNNRPFGTFWPDKMQTMCICPRQSIVSSSPVATTSLHDENTENFGFYECEVTGNLQLKPVAITIGDTGFEPARIYTLLKQLMLFSVVSKQGNMRTEVTLRINMSNVEEVVYTRGNGNKNFLAFALDAGGRQYLASTLQLHDLANYWNLIFYIAFDQSVKNYFISRLTGLFGCKLRQVAPAEWKEMPCLVENILLVMKFSRSLKKSQNALKGYVSFEGLKEITSVPSKMHELGDTSSNKITQYSVPSVKRKFEEVVKLEDNGISLEEGCVYFGDPIKMCLHSLRYSLRKNTFLFGSVATFCIAYYIPKVVHPANWLNRKKVGFFNTEAYEFIRLRCKSRTTTPTNMNRNAVGLFSWKKKSTAMPPFFRKFLDFEVWIVPLIWENHWILAIHQWLTRYKNSSSARLILMDSKFHGSQNRDALSRAAKTIHNDFALAIESALLMAGLRSRLERFSLIQCESLPCQQNNIDCGWFMVLFAEHFTKNMSWMEMSDEEIRTMKLTEEDSDQFHHRLGNIKEEIGRHIERSLNRSLYLRYDELPDGP